MKSQRAMTLLEIIIVFALMGLMTTCLYNTFLPGIRVWRRSDIKTQVQQNALIAVQRISKELRSSDIKSVVIIKGADGSVPDSMTFLSPSGPDGRAFYDASTASVLWNKHGIFYVDSGTHTLHLQEQYFASPTDSPPSYQLQAFTPRPANDRVIARNIRRFSCSASPDTGEEGSVLKNPVSLTVTASLQDFTSTIETAISAYHQQD